jgi:hypothetical protein
MRTRSRISISVTRGTVTRKIGVVKGGHWGERLVARIRLWLWKRETAQEVAHGKRSSSHDGR